MRERSAEVFRADAIAAHGCPEIINSDHGSQFTSNEYVKLLEYNGISISMDSRRRALDDIYIEHLWRSVKQEYVYENSCCIFDFYNNCRPHQSLGYQCPATVYMKKRVA